MWSLTQVLIYTEPLARVWMKKYMKLFYEYLSTPYF